MRRLEKKDYKRVKCLLDDKYDNLEVLSVLNHRNPGEVYYYEYQQKGMAMIWVQGVTGFYFVGDHHLACQAEICQTVEQLKPWLKSEGIMDFEFSGENDQWNPVLEEVFKGYPLKQSTQQIYRHEGSGHHPIQDLPEGYSLHLIDQELLHDATLLKKDELVDEIKLWWGSLDQYLKYSRDYCIVYDNMIVHYCMTDFVQSGYTTIGIETHEGYRRKGLASIAASHYVKEAHSRGLVPYWECMGKNIASQALAESLGFELTNTYTLFEFSLNR